MTETTQNATHRLYYEWSRTWGHCVRSTEQYYDPSGEYRDKYVASRIPTKALAMQFAASGDTLEALLLAPCHKAVTYDMRAPEPSDFWVEGYGEKCPRCAAIAKARGES